MTSSAIQTIYSYLHRRWLPYTHLNTILFCNITCLAVTRVVPPASSHEIIIQLLTITEWLILRKSYVMYRKGDVDAIRWFAKCIKDLVRGISGWDD